jgi:hypothetical protein
MQPFINFVFCGGGGGGTYPHFPQNDWKTGKGFDMRVF